jgi:hypothetical protein
MSIIKLFHTILSKVDPFPLKISHPLKICHVTCPQRLGHSFPKPRHLRCPVSSLSSLLEAIVSVSDAGTISRVILLGNSLKENLDEIALESCEGFCRKYNVKRTLRDSLFHRPTIDCVRPFHE